MYTFAYDIPMGADTWPRDVSTGLQSNLTLNSAALVNGAPIDRAARANPAVNLTIFLACGWTSAVKFEAGVEERGKLGVGRECV